LHITGIDDPESVKHIAGGLDVVGKRLEQFANHLVLLYNLYPLQKICRKVYLRAAEKAHAIEKAQPTTKKEPNTKHFYAEVNPSVKRSAIGSGRVLLEGVDPQENHHHCCKEDGRSMLW
jgi:hypothetical protein